ncbi:hypothetical protein T06_9509 [Trichinella sp. T6]|nr:hypothetical protein T06_9509 [Trichinella sp. T6]
MHYELSNCAAEFVAKILNARAVKSKTVPKSQFIAFRGVYHELLEKEAALQNVEDPLMRAELESDFGE